MKTLFYILGVFVFTSCSRSVYKHKTSDRVKNDSLNTVVDNSKTVATFSATELTKYGDTLNGNIFLPVSPDYIVTDNDFNSFDYDTRYSVFDSLESAGVKIRVGIKPAKGGFNAHINAIAKPFESYKSTVGTVTTNNKISKSTAVHQETSKTETTKQTKKSNTLFGVAALFIAGIFLYFFLKRFKIL